MSPTNTVDDSRTGAHTTSQKTGLVLGGLLSAVSIPSVVAPTPDGEIGPPLGILILGSVLGVIGLVAVLVAWRTGNPAAVRVAAGALIVNMLAGLPAFFVDVPAGIKVLVGVSVLLTVLAVALMFSRTSRPAPVLD
jgi:hypothetical protein